MEDNRSNNPGGSSPPHMTRRTFMGGTAAGLAISGLALTHLTEAAGRPSINRMSKGELVSQSSPVATNPTVVLVHGAFGDSSAWNGVIPILQAAGYTVIAVPNELRGIASDSP